MALMESKRCVRLLDGPKETEHIMTMVLAKLSSSGLDMVSTNGLYID
jgi:hypothetical protein